MAVDYSQHLDELTSHLAAAGLETSPMTQAALAADPTVAPLSGRLLARTVCDAAWVAAGRALPSSPELQAQIADAVVGFLTDCLTTLPPPLPNKTEGEAPAAVPALLPYHALPLYYVVRNALVRAMWPRDAVVALVEARPSAEVEVRGEVETVLGQVYATVSVQTQLLALYGGSATLLRWLTDEEDEDEVGEDDVEAVAEGVAKVQIDGVEGDEHEVHASA
ncbi:hypothetical protein H9P43_001001 [Blastocladiella emersonii ATCC 22665]|nr:hypothetical protein H9P43_001001 [Blastocladiella emersonii ATCC 22665]